MPKKSKLIEKPTRFTVPGDEKRETVFEEYKRSISQLNVETARAQQFLLLIKEWFADARPGFIEEYLGGVEKTVKKKEKDIIIAGRVDALYGNVIIEFESSLTKKLNEAKEQLQRYVYVLLDNEEYSGVNFLCIATDGMRFHIYTPRWKLNGKPPGNPADIELREIDTIDFSAADATRAFFWIDRYFFRTQLLHPTTEEFVKDFGIRSPAYNFSMNLLHQEWNRVKDESEFNIIYENWNKYLRIVYGTAVAETELFLRHTYLAMFVKLLAYMRLTDKASVPTEKRIEQIFAGTFFRDYGIVNFLEEDFFSWIARDRVKETLNEITRRIATLLEKYRLQEISEDVLKNLYQELVDPATRHDLGEVYTPDWLADNIIRTMLEDNPSASVLDSSCGSGSFIYFAIRYKREKLRDSLKTLNHIGESVVGIDIHPLAVIIAKTNYLLALGELLKKRKEDFHIPVYMANSLQIPEQSAQMTMGEKVPSVQLSIDRREALIPEAFITDSRTYDITIDSCYDFAGQEAEGKATKELFKKYLTQRLPDVRFGDDDAEVLYSLVEEMKETITSDRNSIWTFILKNVYRPIFLKRKFDIVVGNPPWLSYRYVERGEYQRFLKEAISKDYTLLGKKKGHLITHLELGTLFFCASLDLYTHENGKVAFVLPRSVFTGDQHDAFRKAEFSGIEPKAGITGLWDLENVSPIFNVPACVVFGGKKEAQKFPIAGKIFKGTVPRKNAQLREAMENLETKDAKYHLAQQGERSYWSVDPYLKVTAKSPYITKFFQGATIVPRSCWFVEIKPQEHFGFTPTKPYVKTDARATQHAKQDYKDLILEGNIESDFLYATLLSTDLLPFGYLDHRMVVLPIQPSSDKFKILNAAEARLSGFLHLSDWLEKCEAEWDVRRREKAKKENILDWLNYRKKLTQQNHRYKYKLIYPTSATNICSTVVENKNITIEIGKQKIRLNKYLVDYTTYSFDTDNYEEASYLNAVLNSNYLDELLKPMQARGLWGPRHVCKKIWELPIPGFREDNPDHRKLAELGMQCTEKVKEIIPTLDTQNVTPGKIGRLRGKVRKLLEEEIGEIDGVVEGILI